MPDLSQRAATIEPDFGIALDDEIAREGLARINSDPNLTRRLIATLGARGYFRSSLKSCNGESTRRVPDLEFLVRLVQQLARRRCWGLTLSTALHLGVFVPLAARWPAPGQTEEFLGSTLDGRLIGAIAASDGGSAGSDFMGMATTAEFGDDGIHLSGEKLFVTSGMIADYAVVFARWRPGRHFANFCALLVPMSTQGLIREPMDLAVMRGAGIARLRFDGVRLPIQALIGRRTLGMKYFLEHIAMERVLSGAWAVALAADYLKEAVAFASERVVGEAPLWRRSAVRQRFARLLIDYLQLDALVEDCICRTRETPAIDLMRASAIKAAAPALLEQLVSASLQIRGAQGLRLDSVLLQDLIELRAFSIGGGTTEAMLESTVESWLNSGRQGI